MVHGSENLTRDRWVCFLSLTDHDTSHMLTTALLLLLVCVS